MAKLKFTDLWRSGKFQKLSSRKPSAKPLGSQGLIPTLGKRIERKFQLSATLARNLGILRSGKKVITSFKFSTGNNVNTHLVLTSPQG